MKGIGKVFPCVGALLLAGTFQAGAQITPIINLPTATPPGIQSGIPATVATPSFPAAITVNTNQPNGIVLFINGNFTPARFLDVVWTNTITTQTFTFSVASVTATQIQVNIPANFFQAFTVTFPQPVTVKVDEFTGNGIASATGTFTINPPLAALANPILTPGTVGVGYSQPIAQFGTQPYTTTLQSGSLPPGLNLPNGNGDSLTGTPTTIGVYNWTTTVTDVWGNALLLPQAEATEIVGVPTMASVIPNTAPAGSPPVAITVTGTNFVPTANPLGQTISSSLAGIAGDGFFSFATNVTSTTQLQATVPQNSLLSPSAFIVSVEQPNGVLSNPGLAFSVVGPVITSLSPSATITARPAAFTITVNGANFVANNALAPTASSVVVNNVIAPTSNFVNGTMLTESQVFTPGTYQIQVENPGSPLVGGTLSNAATLTVLAAPTITSIAPTFATAGAGPVALTVTGTNYTNTMQVQFAGTALTTAFVSATQLNASIPAALIGTAGNYGVTVVTADGYATSATSFTVLASPTITSIAPTFAIAGTGPVALTVTGTNYTNTMLVKFAGAALATSFVNATKLTATIPAAALTTAGNKAVTVVTTDNYVTPAVSFNVATPLVITTMALPSGTSGSSLNATLTAAGGTPPYTWSGTGLQGLILNPRTGALTGIITPASTFTISVTVTDANGSMANANLTVVVTTPVPPPVTITIGNALPQGTVNAGYSAVISAGGGTGGFTFGVDVGSLPPGLTLSAGGVISGTPTTPGTFNFTVKATDSSGNVGTAGFSIVIKPAPLTVTGPANTAPITVGGNVSIQYGATGGVPPYAFNFTGTIPAGTTFGRTALLSGTATTVGTYSFSVVVSDSTLTQVSQGFTIVIAQLALSITGTMPGGQVGVSYSGSIAASGGKAPYTLTVSGLPDGLTFANGSVTGTPTTAKTYTVTAAATDSAGANATATFTVIIQPAPLVISSATLGNGTVGVSYSGSVIATGGAPPYTITFGGLPPGVSPSNGSVSGTPTTAGNYTITVTVTDSTGKSITGTFNVTIAAPGALVITSAAVPNTTLGSSVSATFAATGGVPPYTWSATGLPGGLTLSTGGTLSGTPAAPGSSSFTVTVTDQAGTHVSQSVTVTVGLPATPPVNLTGLPATSNPATQSTLQIGIGTAYPVDVTVTLTLTFAPDSGADDPTVQFASGGRTATVTIPAGSLAALASVGVQTGTVSGTATITARLAAAGTDITPSPAPTRTIRIGAAVATVTSVTAAISGSGFTVTVVGFDTTRSITSAIFTFTPAAGANLQTTTVTVSVTSIFQAWYASSAAAQFGSQFTFTQPFNVQGGVSSIVSVTVVLVDSVGNSLPATATLH